MVISTHKITSRIYIVYLILCHTDCLIQTTKIVSNMSDKKSFSFFRLFANLLIAASAFSLAYTVWAIYDNIRSQALQSQVKTPVDTMQQSDK